MRAGLLAVLLLAAPAAAADEIIMEQVGSYAYEITYRNDVRRISSAGTHFIAAPDEHGPICHLHVEVGAEAETITVTCPPGWLVEPPRQDILDGAEGRFLVTMALG